MMHDQPPHQTTRILQPPTWSLDESPNQCHPASLSRGPPSCLTRLPRLQPQWLPPLSPDCNVPFLTTLPIIERGPRAVGERGTLSITTGFTQAEASGLAASAGSWVLTPVHGLPVQPRIPQFWSNRPWAPFKNPNNSSATLTLGGLRPTLPGRPSTPQLRDDDDDEFSRPGLPPLKLKIPSNGSLNLPFAGSPTRSGSPALPNVPFPRTNSPTSSPPRSRSASSDNLPSLAAPMVQIKSPSPLSAPPSQVAFPSTGSGANTPTSSDSPRPQFPRTASTPSFMGSPIMQRTLSNSSITSTNDGRIILPNGRPLKSSLKSSSSSPNIPFPSQSLVPSRIYAEIAAAQAREREEQARTGTPTQESQDQLHITGYPDVPISNRHARAASAPALPSLLPTADSSPGSPVDSMPQTPSAPKACLPPWCQR
ncbi:hypothetical protein NMY22_g18777 [Coprinellus aureogranulatus]|nr:hypothetical protein NMY22_g18777 [Coprinellus aureogranulatus]